MVSNPYDISLPSLSSLNIDYLKELTASSPQITSVPVPNYNYYANSNTLNTWNSSQNSWATVNMSTPYPTLEDIYLALNEIKERLLLIEEKAVIREKFPTLARAYDQYKMVEQLCKTSNK